MSLDSPGSYLERQKKELELFESRLKEAFVYCIDPFLPLKLLMFPTKVFPIGIITHDDNPLE